ncbi:MAG: DUF1553 domain-containing protein [Pirellulales bacterium]
MWEQIRKSVAPVRPRALWRERFAGIATLLGLVGAHPCPATAEDPRFNRDIRPILSDLCFQCHGPDKNQRQADLRLDEEASTVGTAERPGVVRRGDVDASELWRRLVTTDPDERMPPPATGRQLTSQQLDLIRRWIAAGAPWEGHWSFLPLVPPPVPSELPAVSADRAPRSPLDRFVLAALPSRQLAPAPEAPRETLLRRVTLDLTGLGPTVEEADDWLADEAPDAYLRRVDRLLASPRFGERLAARWLDAARYADTSGYQSDGPRSMWRWRDWVLAAFNRDVPFDRFTVEQLAGDLLPQATLEQRIATGFNRNHRGNSEGGIIPEEFAVEYVVDRVDTTATVWLGLTLGCARCHEHKFDPVSQREYYGLFAFFNNIPEFGRAIKEGNSPPFVKAPTFLEQEQLDSLDRQLAAALEQRRQLEPQLAAAQTAWEASVPERTWDTLPAGERHGFRRADLATYWALDDEPSAGGALPGNAAFVPGVFDRGVEFTGQGPLALGEVAGFGYFESFALSFWVRPQADRGGTLVSKMTDAPQADGYYVVLDRGRLQLNFVKRWLDDALRVEARVPLRPDVWQHVLVVYDGTRNARGVQLYVDGQPVELHVLLDALNQTFTTKEPFRIGGGGGPAGHFTGGLDEVRVYRTALTRADAERLAARQSLRETVATPAANRSSGAAGKLRDFFLEQVAPEPLRQAWTAVDRLAADRRRVYDQISTVMVMEELAAPRETFVLRRGEYDKPGERVTAGLPASLGTLPPGAPANRLGLALWLVDPAHPLTARVAVNRFWQALFGAGIVKTVEDLGSQGQPPSHPELLDWLACEFQGRGAAGSHLPPASIETLGQPHHWSVKRLFREIVLSHTYRQSSRVTRELLAADPDNRWLARGPRFRLPAEVIRDQALAASGLLVERLGGPSVKPYQPADLWKELATDSIYDQGRGADLYRRSIYTFWKRTVAPPTLMTFDAAGREACVVRETRTNTPLQALALLNEVTFVEAARQLAERTLREGGSGDDSRLDWLFRRATGRRLRPPERAILATSLTAHRARYAADAAAARELLAVGEAAADPQLDSRELAAWTALAGVVLNLDETVTKD